MLGAYARVPFTIKKLFTNWEYKNVQELFQLMLNFTRSRCKGHLP